MADLEGVLARIPGLAGYLAQKQYDSGLGSDQIHQAGGLLSLRNAMDAQNEAQMVRGILSTSPDAESAIQQLSKAGPTGITAASHLQAVEKAKKDAELTKQLGDLSSLSPQQLDFLGGKLALGGHPGASTVMNIADKRRALLEGQSALAGMKQQGAVGDAGPQIPQPGVVPQYLLDDPTYGSSAKALMQRINTGAINSPVAAEKELTGLTSSYNAAQNAKALVAARGEEARKTKATAPGVNAAGVLSPEAVDAAAARYKLNGSLPTNLGRGNQGAVNTALILNKHAENMAEEGQTPAAAAAQQLANKSQAVALTALSKDLAAIGPFHDMLNLNAKIAIDMAKKISSSRTGSQFINRPITWLENNATDNPDIAEYLFQMQTVKTEGARILNNPRLVGQLTDSARHEMGNVVNGNMPLGQTERVLKRMMSDGDNRVNTMTAQRDALIKSFGGEAAPTKPTYVEIRTTASGKKLGKKADGTIEEIK